MVPYKFRLRFDLIPGDHFKCSESEIVVSKSSTKPVVHLRSASRGTPIQDHSRASLLGGPYESEEEARAAAEQTRQDLLIWAVKQRYGVDVGDEKTRGGLTEAGKSHIKEQMGKSVRNDYRGIDVYPDEGDVVFLNFSVQANLGKDAQAFVTEMREINGRTWNLSEKQKLAAELYCVSFFDNVFRSRFITLVTAVEALLIGQQRDPVVQTFVDQAKASVQTLDIESATKQALVSGLERLRQDSIGQAGRRLSDELLSGRSYDGISPGKFFNKCYGIRSQTVHRGAPEDKNLDFLNLANKTQGFVGDLLMASFETSAAQPTLTTDGLTPSVEV